jgi:hypothetical protein
MLQCVRELLRVGAGVLALVLLVPIPVFALSFGNWSGSSTNASGTWTDTGSTLGGTNVTSSTLLIQPTAGSTPQNSSATFSFQVPVTFTVDGNNGPFGDPVAVTASSLNGLHLDAGTLQIQVAVLFPLGGGTTFPVPLTNPDPNVFNGSTGLTLSAPNQFVSVINGTNTYNLQVALTFGSSSAVTSWSSPGTVHTLSITFGP